MTIETSLLAQNPFAVITFIAAPAILTNASSIMTLSTSTRLMRCLDRVNQLGQKLDQGGLSADLQTMYITQMELSHRQSRKFLRALRATYVTLACFAIASLFALLGATTTTVLPLVFAEAFGVFSLLTGAVGVVGLTLASVNLIAASRITVAIMDQDFEHLKRHHGLIP